MNEQASRAVVEMDAPAPMRDGATLYADIYRPEGDGPFPALLQRTPYDKRQIGASGRPLNVRLAIARGFAVVIQDVRGRFASEGAFHTFVNEADDGYDTVEWVAGLPWCSGKVGMIGPSYVGATQWLAASAQPPHLTGIFPMVTASDYHEGWTYQGGVFSLGFNVSWCIRPLAAANSQHLKAEHGLSDAETSEMINAMDRQREAFEALPLTSQPWLRRDTSAYFYEWLEHPSDDAYWQKLSIERAHPNVTVPSFNVGGWYDIFLRGTIRNYTLMRQNGGSEEARSGSRLLIGPWSHSTIANNLVGEIDFSHRATAAGLFLDDVTMRWYDHWLRGHDNGVADDAPVKIFVMGDNVWRDEDSWPLERAERVKYFLHSGGRANSSAGEGWLSTTQPDESEGPDTFLYDPLDPVPTQGGSLCCSPSDLPDGPKDHSEKEKRADVLVYSTPPLEQDTEVTGPVSLVLWASTSAVDTDFTGMLLDVRPCGCAVNLTDGIIRARYQEDRGKPVYKTPNEPHRFDIDLVATSNVFKKGHRIRLEVSSSNFPRFARNLNTGRWDDDDELMVAMNRVYHEPERASYLELDLVPR